MLMNLLQVKLLYERHGHSEVVQDMCHHAVSGLYKIFKEYNVTQRHYSYTAKEIKHLLTTEVGNEYSGIYIYIYIYIY